MLVGFGGGLTWGAVTLRWENRRINYEQRTTCCYYRNWRIITYGNDAKSTWDNALKGVSGIDSITRIDTTDYNVHLAGELKDFDIEEHIPKKEARRNGSLTQYAVVAAREAVNDAKLEINDSTADKIGVWIGSGIGGMETFEISHSQLLNRGPRRVSPFFVPMLIPDMATGQVSIDLGAKGPNGSTVTACATGTNSIGEAFKIIQRGDADAMITGGKKHRLHIWHYGLVRVAFIYK